MASEVTTGGAGTRDARPAAVSGKVFSAGVVACSMALGLYLRWSGLQLAEFNYDQAWSLNRAYEFVAHGSFPSFGEISSMGVPHGPVEIYLLAIPSLFSNDPVVATAYVGALQMLAVLGTYFLAARYFGGLPALVAVALYAANPWAVAFGRKMWPPSVMPLLALLCLLALFVAIASRRRFWFAAACGLAAALAMTHPSGAVFLFVLLLAFGVFWRRIGWAPLALGLLVALVVVGPYLYYDAQQDFAFVRGYLGVAAPGSARVDLSSLGLVFKLASEGGLRSLLATSFRDDYVEPFLPALDAVAMVLLVVGIGVAVYRLVSRRPWQKSRAASGWETYLLLLLWFAVPVALTVRHSMPLSEPYFIAVWPAQFILIGLGLSSLGAVGERLAARSAGFRGWAVAAAGIVALAMVASQVDYVRSAQSSAETVGTRVDWGIPLSNAKAAVANMRQMRSDLGSPQIYVYASSNQWEGLNYLAQPDLPLQKVEPPQVLVLPRDPTSGVVLAIAANDAATQPLGFVTTADSSPIISAAHAFGFVDVPERTVKGADGRVYFRFLRIAPAAGTPAYGLRKPDASLTLGNGLSVAGLGYPTTVKAGEKRKVSVLWEMPANPQASPWQDYVFFAHLVDRTGKTVAQKDWPVFQYRLLWRGGEYVLGQYELDVPGDIGPGLFWLDLGAYEYYSRKADTWRDATGKQMGEAYKTGPLVVSGAKAPAAPQQVRSLDFGGALKLVGYDLTQSTAPEGTRVEVALQWQAPSRPTADYVVSVQLLDTGGRLVAQHDAQPVDGNYPTSYWTAGDTVRDVHAVVAPPGTAAGAYALMLVVYDQRTTQRLPVSGGDSARLADVTLAGGR